MNCKSITISGALVAVLAITPAQLNISSEAISLDATTAFANNGNGNGNGGGNGNAGGNGNGRGNGNAGGGNAAAGGNAAGGNVAGRGNAAGGNVAGRGNAGTSGSGGNQGGNEGTSNNFAAESPRTNSHGKRIGKDRANFARTMSREFKGLNAHRASASAYANANKTNSQVGLIAVYDQARKTLATQTPELEASIKSATDTLMGYGLTEQQIADLKNATEAEIQAAIDSAAITTTVTATDIATALNSLNTAETQLAGLQSTAASAYDAAAKQDQDVQDALDVELQLRDDR